MRKRLPILLIIIFLVAGLLPPSAPVIAQTTPPTSTYPTTEPGVLLVGYREGATPRLMDLPSQAGMAAQGQELQALTALNVIKIRVPAGMEEQVRQELLQDPDVRFVEPDYLVEAQLIPNDPRWEEQYGQRGVNAPDAWDITTGSSSITLAVVDSGIDSRHPEFSGRLVQGYDFVDEDRTPQDDCGHGTHVAGIAAATGNNRAGVAGMDWHAKVMPIRVISDTGGRCSGPTSGLASGILYAVTHGAKIINLSVGLGPGQFSQVLEDAVRYAYQQGVAVFAAAGNNGGTSLLHPASSPYVMAVGATNTVLTDKASFSNSTSQDNQRMIVAPGMSILSTTPLGYFLYEDFGVERRYGLMSGTSMATPFASGAAALMASLPEFNTPEKIYQAMTATARDIGPTAGWDRRTGYGLLQVDLAMGFEDFTPPSTPAAALEYDWVSSPDCPQVEYLWDDASDGNVVPLADQDARVVVQLNAPLAFAGQTFASVVISANGYVAFDPGAPAYGDTTNYPLPWPAPPNLLVSPLWADLTQSVGGQVYFKDTSDRFIVQWDQVSYRGMYPGDSQLTFQVIFYRSSGHIMFQYHTLKGPGSDGSRGTVGIETGPDTGTQYAYNQSGKLKPGLAILFVPAEPGSTRNVLDCLFVTREELTGCQQLPPFGADLARETRDLPDDVQLSIRLLRVVPRNWPESFLSLEHFAEITAEPGVSFARVCYAYTMTDVLRAGGRPQNLFLAVSQPRAKTWQPLSTQADTAGTQLIATLDHLSVFGVFATRPMQLPETGAALAQQRPPVAGLAVLGLLLGCLVWHWKKR